MNFLVDVGNSRIKWGTDGTEGVSLIGNEARPGQAIHEFLDTYWAALPVPDRIVASNVAGHAVANGIAEWVKQHWSRDVTVITSPALGWGVTNGYIEPNRLGTDRWAKLVAVRRHQREDAFIVDFGTAVTMDVLDHTGMHHGGLIMPGLRAMRRALASATQGVKVASLARKSGEYGLLARDTAGAVFGGTTYSLVATVERVAADVSAAMGGKLTRIVTGGDAPQLLPLLSPDFEYIPNLVLNGLAVIAADPA